ncbi:MAG: tRNA (cytidine(34)-2'-O)-methyltransferase [Chromatiales bacterium]|nr:tRNA (cytidine(34)-2'-O)-methyltransferase [Chromatiales bacterium]
MHVVLYEPEIPPNTGNIIRLCANTGSTLHLVGRLGFELDDKRLKRAGLDYHEWAELRRYDSLEEFLGRHEGRCLPCSTRASHNYAEFDYQSGDALLFGPETRGLPAEVLEGFPKEVRLRIPMIPGSRSLNLSNSVAVVLYEAWRQLGFAGAQAR